MLLWRVPWTFLKLPSYVVRSCCVLWYDDLNIIENRHYIKLDNLISHNCILNTNQILLIKMEAASSSRPKDQHHSPFFIRGVLSSKFKNIVTRMFRYANRSQQFVEEVAKKIQNEYLGSPEIVIAYYLLDQVVKESDKAIQADKVVGVFRKFCQALKISIYPPLQLQLHDIANQIANTAQNGPISVSNLSIDQSLTYDCYCQLYDSEISQSECYKCHRRCHSSCFWAHSSSKSLYQCPVCFMTNCLPYRPVGKIFYLGYLQFYPSEEVVYKMKFQLDLRREDIDNIQIRCVRLDDADKFRLTFPDHCTIHLAGKEIKRLEPLSETSVLKKRNDAQVRLEKRLLAYTNTLSLTKKRFSEKTKREDRDNYLMLVVSAKSVNIPKIIALKYQKQRLSVYDSQRKLRVFMNNDGEQCYMQTVTISFQCQYFLSRITCPVRSKQCTTHYQPFDLNNFILASLAAQGSVQAWLCPICRERAYDLQIDQYLLNLLSNHRNILFACFNRDATLRSFQQQKDNWAISLDTISPHKDYDFDGQSQHKEEKVHNQQQIKKCQQKQDKGADDAEGRLNFKRTFEERCLDDEQLEPQLKKILMPTFSPMSQTIEEPTKVKDKALNELQIEAIKSKIKEYFQKKQKTTKSSEAYSIQTATSDKGTYTAPRGVVNEEKVVPYQNQDKQVLQSEQSLEIVEQPLEKMMIRRQRDLLQQNKVGLSSTGLSNFDKTIFNSFCRQLARFQQ